MKTTEQTLIDRQREMSISRNDKPKPRLYVTYAIFALPACITLADRIAIAWVKAQGISTFEGADGYAWFEFMVPCTGVLYSLFCAVLLVLRKRAPVLVGMTAVFAVLSIPALAFFLILIGAPELPLPWYLQIGTS